MLTKITTYYTLMFKNNLIFLNVVPLQTLQNFMKTTCCCESQFLILYNYFCNNIFSNCIRQISGIVSFYIQSRSFYKYALNYRQYFLSLMQNSLWIFQFVKQSCRLLFKSKLRDCHKINRYKFVFVLLDWITGNFKHNNIATRSEN